MPAGAQGGRYAGIGWRRSLRHLVNVVHDLTSRGIGLKVLTGHGAAIETTTPAGKLIFGIFASLAEFERDLISERTRAGLASARARGRKGGRRPKMTTAKLRLAMAAMGKPETSVGDPLQRVGNYPIHALPTCLASWRAT
jgi:DNA invertase Pin-like site-specific DNA recombinase